MPTLVCIPGGAPINKLSGVAGKMDGEGGPLMSSKLPPVHSDPDILGGTPVFVGTRVPARNLLDYLEAGDSLDEFLKDFPSVTREQAIAALEFAKQALVDHARPS
jgi:uncharacterized protein (DUF433 family)